MAYYNLARMYTTTTGTGTVTLTTAVPGCLTFALAGVSNAEAVHYSITTYDTSTHRPTHTETGTGTYTSSGTTLSRTTVEKSTNSNNKITLTGLSEVSITPLASDYNGFGTGGVSFASYYQGGASQVITDTTTGTQLNIDTEGTDPDGIATLGSNTVTLTAAGSYQIFATIYASSTTTAFDGYLTLRLRITDVSAVATYDIDCTHGYTAAMGISSSYYTLGPTHYTAEASDTVKLFVADQQLGVSADCFAYELTVNKVA